jgi:hypothetical protein
MGIFAGWIMLVTGRYKWLVMAGSVIRLIGYGLMLRLRGQYNTVAELFVQQVIKGIGSGLIQTPLMVPRQMVVTRPQISQVLSLTQSATFLGYSVGSAVAGGIYTNALRPLFVKHLGTSATPDLVNGLYNSITGELPAWGSSERQAVNFAVSRNVICFFLNR